MKGGKLSPGPASGNRGDGAVAALPRRAQTVAWQSSAGFFVAKRKTVFRAPFLKSLTFLPERFQGDRYPFNLPILEGGRLQIVFDRPITFFVGDNGTGKSTLLESIAKQSGFGLGGGSRHHRLGANAQDMPLAGALRLAWLPKTSDGFFLRAESFFNFATYIDSVSVPSFYGGTALHDLSHGQAFLAWFKNRFGVQRPSIYLLDEPEAALSPARQLEFLRMLRCWEQSGMAQFIVATHSPIIMSYPGATLFSFDGGRIREVAYTATDHYRITRDFLQDPAHHLELLFSEPFASDDDVNSD